MSLRKRRPYQECAYFWGAMHKKRMKKPGWDLFMRLCGRRSGSAALRHAVADAHLCEEILRLGGIFFDLPADVGHVYPENLVVAAGPGAPQLLDDEIIRQNLLLILYPQYLFYCG